MEDEALMKKKIEELIEAINGTRNPGEVDSAIDLAIDFFRSDMSIVGVMKVDESLKDARGRKGGGVDGHVYANMNIKDRWVATAMLFYLRDMVEDRIEHMAEAIGIPPGIIGSLTLDQARDVLDSAGIRTIDMVNDGHVN